MIGPQWCPIVTQEVWSEHPKKTWACAAWVPYIWRVSVSQDTAACIFMPQVWDTPRHVNPRHIDFRKFMDFHMFQGHSSNEYVSKDAYPKISKILWCTVKLRANTPFLDKAISRLIILLVNIIPLYPQTIHRSHRGPQDIHLHSNIDSHPLHKFP